MDTSIVLNQYQLVTNHQMVTDSGQLLLSPEVQSSANESLKLVEFSIIHSTLSLYRLRSYPN